MNSVMFVYFVMFIYVYIYIYLCLFMFIYGCIFIIKYNYIWIYLKNMIETSHLNASMFYSLWLSFPLIAKRSCQVPILSVCSMSSPSHHVSEDSWEDAFTSKSILLSPLLTCLHAAVLPPRTIILCINTHSSSSFAKISPTYNCSKYDFHSQFRRIEGCDHITTKEAI